MASIDRYLKFMIESGASDFHLASGRRASFRVLGNIATASSGSAAEFSQDDVRGMLDEIMPDWCVTQFEETGDGDFGYEIPDVGRFRVNVFRRHGGIGAVFRHIAQEIPSFETLGLPPVLEKFCDLEKGLVLVTGPTGSGKSSTLAAMVGLINERRRDHIITIEDPIEFVHTSRKCLITQREVHRHTESFRKALRAALREDPDIVLLGEMRDLETTETAIEVAETGHLVLATLHTSTASSTVDRIIDQFPGDRQAQIRTMLSVSLGGIVSQTLMPRADGKGRVAAFEILVMTSGIANNIREGKAYQLPTALQTGRKHGMQLLNDDLLRLTKAGIISAEVACRKSAEKRDMATSLRAAGFSVSI